MEIRARVHGVYVAAGLPRRHNRNWPAGALGHSIRRGSFIPVKDLVSAIDAFIDHWNGHPRPIAWTKDADEILASIKRTKTKASRLTDH